MENPFIEDKYDKYEITEKFNIKALYYEINYAQQKVKYDPIFKKWFESQKKERGENGIAFYSRDSKLFFYLINKEELREAERRYTDTGELCEFCGEIQYNYICCIRGGIKEMILEIYLSGDYNCDNDADVLKLSPFSFQIYFFFYVSAALFFERRKSTVDNLYDSYLYEKKCLLYFYYTICFFIGLFSCFIFFIPYTLLYVISIIIIFIHICKKDPNYMFK